MVPQTDREAIELVRRMVAWFPAGDYGKTMLRVCELAEEAVNAREEKKP